MLSIKKSKPWAFWQTRVCSTFHEKAGNVYLSGNEDFKISIELTLKEIYSDQASLITILPHYTAISYINDEQTTAHITTSAGMKTVNAVDTVRLGKKHKFVIENVANTSFEIFIDGESLIKTGPIREDLDPQLLLGAGNYPWNDVNHNYCDIDVHSFTLHSNNVLIADNKFEKFIQNKSYDSTENCNYLFELTNHST